MTKQILAAAFLVLSALSALGARAEAQDNRHRVVVQLPTQTIVGERQQPSAVYVLSRTDSGYQLTELRTTFVPEVIRSTNSQPF